MKNKKSAYERITQQLITAIKTTGKLPWKKSWKDVISTPTSTSTGKPYQGFNALWLHFHAMTQGYSNPHFGTYNSLKKNGGVVKKGEKGTIVSFWKWFEKEDPETGVVETIPFLRTFTVFSVDQADWEDGIPEKFIPDSDIEDHDPIEAAEAIVKGYFEHPETPLPPTLNIGGNRACYVPSKDIISVPEMGQFTGADEYYSTLFHEMGHSTGAKDRLNRKSLQDVNNFGDHAYSREELVAEFTACFLCGDAGIEDTRENSAAYLRGWLAKLEDDPKLLVQASAQANKAARYIHGTRPSKEDN